MKNMIHKIEGRWGRRGVIVTSAFALLIVVGMTAAVAAWLWTANVSGTVSTRDAGSADFITTYASEETVSSANGSATWTVVDSDNFAIAIDNFTPGDSATGAVQVGNVNAQSIPVELLSFDMDGADVEVIAAGDTPVGDRAIVLEYDVKNHDGLSCGTLSYSLPLTLVGGASLNSDNSRCFFFTVTLTENAQPGVTYDMGTGGIAVSSN